MTISDALRLLQALLDKHGDVDVYFDCPYCEKSFAPTTVKALGAHITGELTRRRAEKERRDGD